MEDSPWDPQMCTQERLHTAQTELMEPSSLLSAANVWFYPHVSYLEDSWGGSRDQGLTTLYFAWGGTQ